MIASPETLEVDSKPGSGPKIRSALPMERVQSNQTAGDAVDETLYLLGRPTLKQLVRFVKSHAVNPADAGALNEEWQAAHRQIETLQKLEAGFADNPRMTPLTELGKDYEELLLDLLKSPLLQNHFNTVPTDIALVELDRLVVYQKHIDLTFVETLKRQLGPMPDEAAIFDACLPFNPPQPPVKWSRVHRDTFVFMSPSNDLRFLETMRLEPNHIANYPPPGSVVGVIGLAVGFGTNFLNAIYAEGRLILNNGSHRAYALRDLGVTHVPCIVQHVSSREELDLVASDEVREHPDLYLKQARPSVLKDYFDPKLRKIVPVHRRMRQITVKFQIDEAYVPAF